MSSNALDLNGVNLANVLSIAEALEARRLLSGPACVPVGVLGANDLYVNGTDGDDTIDVRLNGNAVEGNLNGQNYVSCSNLRFIQIYGYDGVDRITVQPEVSTQALIRGGDKGDYIAGGSGDDVILGEGGNDVITGSGGNDYIDGGADNDQLTGWIGNDTLTGGSGRDYMWGDSGDDYFENNNDGEIDIIDGGDNYDTVYGYDTVNPADVLLSIENGGD